MCITFPTLPGRDCFGDKHERGQVILTNSFQSNTTISFIKAVDKAASVVLMNE